LNINRTESPFKWTGFRGAGHDEDLFSVQFLDQAVGWAVGGNGTILATIDGGQNWQAQKAPTDQNLFSVYFLDQTNGWAVGWSGTILATTDGGKSWETRETDVTALLSDVAFQPDGAKGISADR